MTTYRYVISTSDMKRTVESESATNVLVFAEKAYCDNAGEPADDPDYVRPDLSWVLSWGNNSERVLRLRVDGRITDVHVDEVTEPPAYETVPQIADCDRCNKVTPGTVHTEVGDCRYAPKGIAEFERVVDYDGDEIWWSPSEGEYHYVNPGSEMEPDTDWHPVYRRVTEPAGSVTT